MTEELKVWQRIRVDEGGVAAQKYGCARHHVL